MNIFIKQFGKPDGVIGRLFGKMMTVSNRNMHKAVLSELSPSGNVLEIGFGSGSQLEMIHDRYPEVRLYGIDISSEMLTAAEKRIGKTASLSLCDCTETAFADGYLDAVISTDSCYFWREYEQILNEIKRITKPSGKLILAYNSMYANAVHKSDGGLGMYDDKSISEAVNSAGMKIVSVRSCGYKQKIFTILIKGEVK
ncbi:MAG: class I SAM-dependent methyltransferase [Oscillospiraceae bacterium]|nr:class I SAM-dependent methyltransferase [Oscillospiraceae bacterium]